VAVYYRRKLLFWFKLTYIDEIPEGEAAILQFLQMEKDDVNEWLLQVELIQTLGINVHGTAFCPVQCSESRFFHK
jgi:hypothetical protein